MTPIQSLSRHASQPSFVAALASVACISSFFDSSKNNVQDSATLCEEVHCTKLSSTANKPMILASSTISNGNIVSNNRRRLEENKKKDTIAVADYIIIGYGKAGQYAVRTIKELDPTAHIVIIDPSNNYLQQQSSDDNDPSIKSKRGILNRNKGSEIHLHTRATFIDHSKKLINIHPTDNNDTTTQSIRYKKSVLLATGSRAAPPPESCVRQDAKDRILELRSTSSSSSSSTLLDPTTVRSLSIMAASQLATVSIMGSGFEALELAAYCARVSQQAATANGGGQTSSKDEEKKKVQLLFGNAAPLSNILPRYLSAAVSKRLRQNGIQVEERALTRYISLAYDNNGIQQEDGNKAAQLPKLEIYTVKSYDSLDSKQLKSDLLVYAPSVDGHNGTAVLPTNTLDNNNYLPWSSLVTPPILTSYLDDGRLVTNAELQAASSIYAAGSCAKYPNVRTGQLDTAGGRHVSAHLAGEIAAHNMVNSSSSGDKDDSSTPSYIQESIPVWRSDVIPYLPTTTSNPDDDDSKTLALYSMGIHALCVGKCDSESMATHGYWWTNQSSSSNSGGSSESSKNGNGGSNSNPNRLMKRATRSPNTTNLSTKITKRKTGRGSLPVYGSGVVYYLNRSGGIEGIMLWGLPYSIDPNNAKSKINNDLVERLKTMIRSNGNIAIEDHSDKISRENGYGLSVDIETSYLLSYLHLAEESKHLASMALSGKETSRRVSVTGRPLHRYTPIKPVELTNLGKMTRHDKTGQVTSSDDLFYTSMPSSSQHAQESGRPPSLKRIYPMQSGGTIAGTEEYELEKDIAKRQLQMERSRPSKEEPLWLRPAEEYRLVNRKDALADSFARNIQRGIFADGRDSVRQAPVPRIYLDAKEKLSNLMSEDEKESDVDE